MEEELSKKFDQIKKDMVLSFTKFSLTGENEQNQDAVLSSVLFSWCTGVDTVDDFIKKYNSFKQQEKLIQDSILFDLVESISSREKDCPQAEKAVVIYDKLLDNSEYRECSHICGYKLPVEFGVLDYYFDGTLKDRVSFYHSFTERLDEMFNDLSVKGVVRR